MANLGMVLHPLRLECDRLILVLLLLRIAQRLPRLATGTTHVGHVLVLRVFFLVLGPDT